MLRMAERAPNKTPAKPFLSKASTDGKAPSEATPVTDKDRYRFRYKYNGITPKKGETRTCRCREANGF